MLKAFMRAFLRKKRFLIIFPGIFILLAGGLFVTYNIIAARLVYGSVPVVNAPEEAFSMVISDMPGEIQEITAEEFRALYDMFDELTDEEIRAFIERVFNKRGQTNGQMNGQLSSAQNQELVTDAIFERTEISDRIINIMILGDDARIYETRSNSDTMILVSINRDTREILLISFMRDMFVPTRLSGATWFRINTIYAGGGPGRTLNVMNHLFSLDIQRYVVLRFASVFELVDILGGLDLELRADEAVVINRIFPEFEPLREGLNHMNGRQVLAYVRMRQWDGMGDIGRTARQRYVMRTVIDRVLGSRSFTEIITMANYAINHIETNITMDELISLAFDLYMGEKPVVRELRLPENETFTHALFNEAAVLVVNFEKNITALHEFVYGCAEGVNVWNFASPGVDTTVYNFLREVEIENELNEDEVILEFMLEAEDLVIETEGDEVILLAGESGENEAGDEPEGNPDFEDSPRLVLETDEDPEQVSDPVSLVRGQ